MPTIMQPFSYVYSLIIRDSRSPLAENHQLSPLPTHQANVAVPLQHRPWYARINIASVSIPALMSKVTKGRISFDVHSLAAHRDIDPWTHCILTLPPGIISAKVNVTSITIADPSRNRPGPRRRRTEDELNAAEDKALEEKLPLLCAKLRDTITTTLPFWLNFLPLSASIELEEGEIVIAKEADSRSPEKVAWHAGRPREQLIKDHRALIKEFEPEDAASNAVDNIWDYPDFYEYVRGLKKRVDDSHIALRRTKYKNLIVDCVMHTDKYEVKPDVGRYEAVKGCEREIIVRRRKIEQMLGECDLRLNALRVRLVWRAEARRILPISLCILVLLGVIARGFVAGNWDSAFAFGNLGAAIVPIMYFSRSVY